MYKIINKKLTERGIELTFSEAPVDVEKVFMDKIGNHEHSNSVKSNEHDFVPAYTIEGEKMIITTTADMPAMSTISIFKTNELFPAMVLFLNEYSLFKSKTIYLESFNSNCCSNYKDCKRYNTMINMLTYMMRLNLLHQCYANNNSCLAAKYYEDVCRTVNMDTITFENIDLDPASYVTSDSLFDLFDRMNTTIKNSISPCANKMFETLLLSDLYGLLTGMTNGGGKPNWILEDRVWNLDCEYWYDNKKWKG